MKRSTLLALPLLTLMSWSSVRAEDAAAPKSLIGLRCKDEAAKLCADVPPGAGKLARCLRGHDADLAEPCKTALAAGWRGKKAEGGAPPAAAAPAPEAAAAPAAAKPAGEEKPAKGKGKKHHGHAGKAEAGKAEAKPEAKPEAAKAEAPKAEAPKPAAPTK